MDRKKKDKKQKKEKVSKEKKEKSKKGDKNSQFTPTSASPVSLVKPAYLGRDEVHIPKNEFTEGEWERAGSVLASDSSFSKLSIDNTSIDETNIKHIRKIISENTHCKELKLFTVTITQTAFEILCGALKQNSTLEQLSFSAVGLSLGQFQTLSDCLQVNRGVKRLLIHKDTFYPLSADNIKNIFIKNPNIDSLTLSEVAFQAAAFDKIAELIQNAPNLTELDFTNMELDEKKTQALLTALKANKNIKKLMLSKALKDSGMLQLGELLDANTHIEELGIANKPLDDEAVTRLMAGLKSNYSLKALNCMINTTKSYESLIHLIAEKSQLHKLRLVVLESVTDHSPIARLLREDRTLRELDYFAVGDVTEEILGDVFRSIKLNKGLRKFTWQGDFAALNSCVPVYAALKENDSLTHLSFQPTPISPEQFWARMLETMPHNKSLVSVSIGYSEGPREFKEFLERNKAEQLKHIRRVRSVIKLIVLRAEQFALMLPLEIWAMIFSAIELPGVTVDFGQVMVKQINSQ